MCWQLDPTKGPGRVRRRMMRAPLTIPRKHILPEGWRGGREGGEEKKEGKEKKEGEEDEGEWEGRVCVTVAHFSIGTLLSPVLLCVSTSENTALIHL